MNNHKRIFHILVILNLFSILVLVSPGNVEAIRRGAILYVKSDEIGLCSSWADACDLQKALTDAIVGDEIWVAAGTYKPTNGTDRNISFNLKSDVKIFGGFPPEGGNWALRDPWVHITTLSGDIGVQEDTRDNSIHVVWGANINAEGKLDGFYIRNGNANVSGDPSEWGGGLYCAHCQMTLQNISFQDNFAKWGAGFFINSGNPLLDDVEFINNHATEYGGGMYSYNVAAPVFMDVTFAGNSAGSKGGGLFNDNHTVSVFTNVHFWNNYAVIGGGIYNQDSSLTMTEVSFVSNTVTEGGGGMYNFNSSLVIEDATFSDNKAVSGGALYNVITSMILENALVANNKATQDGGGIYNENSQIEITNVTLENNSAVKGGGLYNWASDPIIVNATITDNLASESGGGLHNNNASSPNIINSILWGNSNGQIYNFNASILPQVTYSIVQGDHAGLGNIDQDPLLAELEDNGGLTMTRALTFGSPAIDAGSLTTCPPTDQRGLSRPKDGDNDGIAVCDMGAYELQVTFNELIYLPIVIK